MYRMGMKHGYLYLSMAVAGAAIAALEILGARILVPFFGASLSVSSALVAVTFGALGAGFALGGKWADRGSSLSRLGVLLCGAGLWILIVPWLSRPLLRLSEPLDIRAAAPITAVILFALPFALLGAAIPHAIKLRASSLDEIGRSSGSLIAALAAAGVASTLLVVAVLIPSLGVKRLALSLGIILIATAAVGIASKRRGAPRLFLPFVILAAGVGLDLGVRENGTEPERGLAFEGQSPYGEIRVVDDQSLRYLLVDGAIRAAIDTSFSGESVEAHVNAADITRSFFKDRGSLLLIGLGGGSIAGHFHRAGWEVDAIEPDPLVAKVAHGFFGLRATDARVFTTDGRRFLSATGGTYDVILLDLSASGSIPFHLVTREFFRLAASRLKTDGILAADVPAIGWNDDLVLAVAATLRAQFANVLALPDMEPPNAPGDVLLLASRRGLDLAEGLPVPTDRFSPEYDRAHAWDNRFEARAGGAAVCTDDRSAADLLADRISARQRKNIHESSTKENAAW